jgi:leucyl aminopeptidase
LKISLVPDFSDRDSADLLVLPFWEGCKEAADIGSFKKKIDSALKSGDFKGKNGETLFIYLDGDIESRILLLGFGKEATSESVRRSLAAAVRAIKPKSCKSVNFVLPNMKKVKNGLRGFLTNYSYTELKGSTAPKKSDHIEKICLIGLDSKEKKFVERIQSICSGVLWVRDLVNRNSDDKHPMEIAKMVQTLAKGHSKLKVKVLGKSEIVKEKMGLLLAVNRSSTQDPCLVQMSYFGDPKSKEHIILVGKGITYDTGGLSLKPTDGMLTMKSDMSGAATVIAAVQVAADLGLKVNVTALAPMTENVIGSGSYKPGDVYRASNGKTVEITNTDAEGRLVLADALCYATKHLKPTCMVDIASLTGSVIIGIGNDIAGFCTQDDDLSKQLMTASDESDEPLWRLPMKEDYRDSMKSDIADLVNSGGRDAGAIKAAFFLEEFTDQVRWAHIDFAGPCFLDKPKFYNTTKATGFGVRLFIEFLEQYKS